MKFIISFLFAIGILFSTQLNAQNDTPIVTLEYQEVVDTIITFDPETFEETVHIVRRKIKEDEPVISAIQADNMQSDTIIYFDKETEEERMVIVTQKGERPQELDIPPLVEDGAAMQIDTIITFDPKTLKETIQVVKRKKKN